MKNNYKNLLLTVTLSLSFFLIKAQVSGLFFTQFVSGYTAISGGTVLGTTTSDDQVFVDPAVLGGSFSGSTGPGFNIGFTFMYNAIPFDRIGVNNNGWIFFGQSTLTPQVNSNSSSGYTGISASSTAPANLQHRVAGLARDLQGQAGSSLMIQTIGVTPNQICVIQWSGYRKFAAAGDLFDFQIRLYETSNVIDVVYGNFVNGITAGVAEVGLRGASNADFNNRIVNAGNPWSVSLPGVTNNANVSFNNTGLVPQSGLTYRWINPVPCSGAPSSNTVISSQTLICPNGNVNLGLVASYSNTGLSYQWFSSTLSSVGPFTAISGATTVALPVIGQTVSTWYQSVITCSVSLLTAVADATNGVFIAGTTTNNVPYMEGFEGIGFNNRLPNCSWSSANIGTTFLTFVAPIASPGAIPASGLAFARFSALTGTNVNHVYTNGIQLEAGVTYSTGISYITDLNTNSNWTDLSLLIGSTQSTVGLVQVASSNGPAVSSSYITMSNTFVVSVSGLYYMDIRATNNGNASANLTIDNLFITAPCNAMGNSPVIAVTGPTAICSGKSAILTASGASSYTWSTGANSTSISVAPFITNTYTISGTNPLSGCTSMATRVVNVNTSPIVSIFANPNPTICSGSSVNLTALGATSYTWDNTSNSNNITVSPNATTSYTVIGGNSNGCTSSLSQIITVTPKPAVTALATNGNNICLGDGTAMVGSGASTFMWNSGSTILQGTNVTFIPQSLGNVNFTITGTDASGCTNTNVLALTVSPCLGLNSISAFANGINVYPNPTAGEFTIETISGLNKTITVSDISGRTIIATTNNTEATQINLNEFANGIYTVKIVTANSVNVIKVVKN
jgi:hypothetical protein